jgi:TetR/AcrR family transcriptional regulator, lmrAB and yxaGH operons repressor
MTSPVRQRMIESAVVLLAKQGYRATSFDSVLDRAKAPRGSIYHHFPGGKDQLIAAAIEMAGARALSVLDALEGRSPPEIVDGFMAMWRSVLERSDMTAGCSVLAVTVSAESTDLLTRAGDIFRAWRQRLAALLESGGVTPTTAAAFAATLVAASEGAVGLSRAERSLAPFDEVTAQLRIFAEAVPTTRSGL